MCLKIILKVTKNQGSTLSLEDTFFEKPQGVQTMFEYKNNVSPIYGDISPETFSHKSTQPFHA